MERNPSENVFLTYELGQIAPLFSTTETGIRQAEKAIHVIRETLMRTVEFAMVDEASFIMDMRRWDYTELLPAECIMRGAIEHACDHHPENLDEWKSMQLAAQSIDELLAWPNSVYNVENPPATCGIKRAPIITKNVDKPAQVKVANCCWQHEDLVVMQLPAGFGGIITSFQVKLLNHDSELRRRVSRSMSYAMAATATYLSDDTVLKESQHYVFLSGWDVEACRTARGIIDAQRD